MNAREMITVNCERTTFNMRVVGVAVADGHVLLQPGPHWILPGGRLELMEVAAAGLAREMREELGVEVAVGRLLWVVENFFSDRGVDNHALEFYFAIQLPAALGPALGSFQHVEEDASGQRWPMTFEWVPIATAVTLDLYPLFLRRALVALPSTPEHVVNDERAAAGGS